MANKRKRKPHRPASAPTATPAAAPRPVGTSPERRDRKELARQAREAARKRAERAARIRRLTTFAVIGVVGLGVVYFFQRAASPRPHPAVRDRRRAGGRLQRGADAGRERPRRLSIWTPAQSYTYTEHPGDVRAPRPISALDIPPRVYPAPIQETNAVHNLEHGAVIMYYRAVGRRRAAAGDRRPADHDRERRAQHDPGAVRRSLPDGTALALAAWNKLQTCPRQRHGASRPATSREGSSSAYLCTSNAPEGNLGEGC